MASHEDAPREAFTISQAVKSQESNYEWGRSSPSSFPTAGWARQAHGRTNFPIIQYLSAVRPLLSHSTNNNPPISTDAQSTQAGQAIHFNATAAYNIYKGLWIGPNAYYLKQITNGKLDGVELRNSPEQVGAIGPGIVWNHRRWFFYANGYQEFSAQNRATGHKLVLRIEKTF
jgi:hypothetical protein